MKRLLAILLIFCFALPVCAKKHQNEEIITPQIQLEKRKFQTRTYKAKDSAAVLKSILNVLQDEGYLVYNVNSLLGFVYAVKDFDTTDPNIDISKEFGLSKSRLNYNGIKVATIETSANVTPYGDNLRVRINFKRKLLNQYGNAQFIDDVSETEFYDNFYEKLDNALALQSSQEEIKVNSTDKKVPVIGEELLQEINEEVLKIIKEETPVIPEISASETTEATPQTGKITQEEQPKNETAETSKSEEQKAEEPKTEEVKQEETETTQPVSEEIKTSEPKENTVEQKAFETKEQVSDEVKETEVEKSQPSEEITEEKQSKKEKKEKKNKNKKNSESEEVQE